MAHGAGGRVYVVDFGDGLVGRGSSAGGTHMIVIFSRELAQDSVPFSCVLAVALATGGALVFEAVDVAAQENTRQQERRVGASVGLRDHAKKLAMGKAIDDLGVKPATRLVERKPRKI